VLADSLDRSSKSVLLHESTFLLHAVKERVVLPAVLMPQYFTWGCCIGPVGQGCQGESNPLAQAKEGGIRQQFFVLRMAHLKVHASHSFGSDHRPVAWSPQEKNFHHFIITEISFQATRYCLSQ
jgi:hypothetical protein